MLGGCYFNQQPVVLLLGNLLAKLLQYDGLVVGCLEDALLWVLIFFLVELLQHFTISFEVAL